MYSYKRERAKRLYPEPAIFNKKMASYGIPSRFRLNYRLLQDGNRTERDIGVHRLATLIDEKDGLRVETDWDVKEICMGESDPAVEKR